MGRMQLEELGGYGGIHADMSMTLRPSVSTATIDVELEVGFLP